MNVSYLCFHLLPMAWTGKALASHLDKSARLESQVKQLIQMANQQQSKLDLRPLFDTIEHVKQKIALMETYDQRLGVLGLSVLFCTGVGFCRFTGSVSRGSGATVSQFQLFARKDFLLAKTKPWCCVCCVLPPYPTPQCLLNSCGTAGSESWPWSGWCTVVKAGVLCSQALNLVCNCWISLFNYKLQLQF